MSYIVSYEPELDRWYPKKQDRHVQFPFKKIFLFLSVCGAVYAFVRFGLVRFLIPGDPVVTAEAFSNMLSLVKEGESVGDAITAFVQDVLAGGR